MRLHCKDSQYTCMCIMLHAYHSMQKVCAKNEQLEREQMDTHTERHTNQVV